MASDFYNPRAVVKDGPFTAERRFHHLLKAVIALAIYAGARDALHLTPIIAAVIASPAFMVIVTIKEWVWPSDVNEHSYPFSLRFDDFVTDTSCTLPAVVLAALALKLWYVAAGVLVVGFILYRVFRHGARP